MNRLSLAFVGLMLVSGRGIAQRPAADAAAKKPDPPPVQPTAEDLRKLQVKTDELGAMVRELGKKRVNDDLVADVAVYEKAGRWLIEFPDEFFTQDGINHAMAVLDTGLERARQLLGGQSPWLGGQRRTHGYRSALDGSIQPYGVMLPVGYDASKPARLYVWMHGRAKNLTEAEFLHSFPKKNPAKPPVAEFGQIQLEVYGRWNGAGYHFAGEADVFEALAAVQKRYNIDPKRILLRGFSMGGEGAWHIALHHPDRWAAAEIGAGTWSKRGYTTGYPPHQQATLTIWENIPDWALNAFNLPLAGHDGENDGAQLESSIKAREQLAKEGFPSEGADKYSMIAKGTRSIFLMSKDTGHGTSPLVRERLDAFLKEHGDRGLVSPGRIRFVTYTTRYNRNHWVTVDALDKHYERADVDADRSEDGARYKITTHNVARLTLREMDRARQIEIDGREVRVKAAPVVALEKSGAGWRPARKLVGLHKVHGLSGPIEDAFLEPFLLVRPTGKPWNEAVNQQVLRTLARFDRLYARFLRAHPRVVDDTEVTAADFKKYNVVLFGDPGSNRWIPRVLGKLPVRWTRDAVSLGGQTLPASEHFPALVYPSPLGPGRYVVLNTGLTIEDRGYRGDYGMPQLGDFALLKVKPGEDVAETAHAGLFSETWR